MVAVDSIGKHSHLVKTVTTVTATGAANLYLQNIWKLHSLLQKVVSDRRPQFITAFMKELYRLLGIKAVTSTDYHLQTDGQIELVNQKLEQYLQIFVRERQDNLYTLFHTADTLPSQHQPTPPDGLSLVVATLIYQTGQ